MMLPFLWIACLSAVPPPQSQAATQQPPRIVLVDDTTELDAALTSRMPPRDVPIRIAAFTLPADDSAAVRLLILAELDASQATGSRLASVAFALDDERGQRRAHALRRLELRQTASGTLAFADVVTVPPGAYRLRLAMLRNSRVGTADAKVAARLQTAASCRFGDVLIGETAGADAPIAMTTDQRVRGGTLVASLPIGFDGEPPSDVAIGVEIAKDRSGAAIVSMPMPLAFGAGNSRLAQAVLDARLLPAGEYTARVGVSVGGREAAQLVAPFSLERADGALSPGPRPGPASGAAAAAPAFRPDEVLDPAVLGPFLDDLAMRAPGHVRPAIEQAKAGRFVEAAAMLTARDPKDPAGPFLHGLSLFSQKQLQPASEDFRLALRASPEFFVGAFFIGACYAAGGRDPQAINAWQTSLVGLDQYPVVYRLLAEAMTRLGQTNRVLDTLEEALSKWPDNRPIRLRLAVAALEGRYYDRVLEYVDAGIARPPADTDLLFVGMQAIFERVTQRDPARASDSLARLRRYRDAYVESGGSRQSLVAEWVIAVEKKARAER
ncbi:MAG TPA: tetratricopeptide repeat protein [Vicinamibacterales bacterium]|jgi:tetratricopeptide (TPR) repeat protein